MKKTAYCIHVLEKGQRSTFLVRGPVLRMGQGDFCEIRINTDVAHAATIVLQNEELFYINRLTKPVLCGKQRIDPGQRHHWVQGQVISIDQITITLEAASPKAAVKSNTRLGEGTDGQPTHGVSTPPSEIPTANNRKNDSPRSSLQLAIVVLCLIVISGMLFGGRGLVANQQSRQDLDNSFAEIHANLEQTQNAADIHRRMLRLQNLINVALADINQAGQSKAAESELISYCKQLKETRDPLVSKAERTLAGRFSDAFSLMGTRAAKAAASLFDACWSDLQGILAANEKEAGVHSRLTTLAHLLYRSQNVSHQNQSELAASKRDAITFCRSLVEAESVRVTDIERRIARNAVVLLEKGF